MKTFLSLKNSHSKQLPAQFAKQDVRYSEALVEHFLEQFTKKGDIILDPFMGFGTTLLVAEQMERTCYGIEFDQERQEYVCSILQHPDRALHGDSMSLSSLPIPDIDFSITSPPYMGKAHTENPFTAYSTQGGGYNQYLKDLGHIYQQVAAKLKPNGRAVLEVSNLKHEDGSVTTLAWDIARVISEVLHFDGEIVMNWPDDCGYGYDHSYCLVFSKKSK
ncbi:MAG: DNA methyltransferase [Candidatus Obscuribacterales bacterium]